MQGFSAGSALESEGSGGSTQQQLFGNSDDSVSIQLFIFTVLQLLCVYFGVCLGCSLSAKKNLKHKHKAKAQV